MDLDEDGNVDLLSGSYSRMDGDMAGLLQVLFGTDDGSFLPAKTLTGTDGEPLIIPADEEHLTDKICTRPSAVDLDGNGTLDLVVGNFTGTFYVFDGLGEGKFAPQGEWLVADGEPVSVPAHGDPFLVDWDGDGDQDILSGSAQGGVFYIENSGTEQLPSFRPEVELVTPAQLHAGIVLGDDHVTGPQTSTRVWADDVNGDGRLDLLIGDSVTLYRKVEGLSDAEALQKIDEWQAGMNALQEKMGSSDPEEAAAAQEAFSDYYQSLEKWVERDMTGFVWLLLRTS